MTAIPGTPASRVAALSEGMCPFGHALEPVPAALTEGWGRGWREGACHRCRPCTLWRWEAAVGFASRYRTHLLQPPPEGHS